MKKTKFTIPFLFILSAHFAVAQTGQWKLNGNDLSGTEKLGSTNNQPLKFITNNKPRLTLTSSGNLTVNSDQSSLQFALPGINPKPMIFMFPSGTSNTTRMVIAHSPNFSNFGLQYDDNADRFDFLSAGTSIFNVNLGASSVGVNGTFNVTGNSSFTGDLSVNGLNAFGNVGIKSIIPAADLHLAHTNGEVSTHGFRIENSGSSHSNWTFYSANNDGALVLFSGVDHKGFFDAVTGAYFTTNADRTNKLAEKAPDVLNKIMQLDVKQYYLPDNKSTNRKYYGMTAQEVEKVFPEAVSHRIFDSSGKELYSINYSAFGIIAIKAIQEQEKIIDSQRKDIHELKTMVEQLMQRVSALSSASTNAIVQPATITSPYLKQNTPNPFSTSTVINYNIPKNKNAAIEIRSVSGQLIHTYSIQQKGSGQLLINANTLTPGSYYYTLKLNGEKIDSKQMIVLK